MKLYSYIVAHDTGFSPNPFWGCCTLANCKAVIRRTAEVGDWIVGISRKSQGNKLVYAMKIDEIIPFGEYFSDRRFAVKKPSSDKGRVLYKCGDNIYKPLPDGNFKQLESMHSNGKDEDLEKKEEDLGGKNVLVSKDFYYFGSKPLDLPDALHELKVGRGHKNRFSPEIISAFIGFISNQASGVNAPPTKWPSGDDSWKSHQ